MSLRKPYRSQEDREDVISSETWNGGDGTVTFNYLQQREVDTSERPLTPVEEAEGTDPYGYLD